MLSPVACRILSYLLLEVFVASFSSNAGAEPSYFAFVEAHMSRTQRLSQVFTRGRRRLLCERLEARHLLTSFAEFVDPNPNPGNEFGTFVVPLETGNVVVTSPFDDAGGPDAGAVYLFNGNTGELISTLTGSNANDQVGRYRVLALEGGNFVVSSPIWDNGSIANAGAVTFGDGNTGVSGVVDETNSLVGSNTNDSVGGTDVVPLEGGNYVIISSGWDNGVITDAGAVTFGSADTGVTGVISETKSLIGSSANNFVGSGGVTLLEGGNYVVSSPLWDNGTTADVGAVTLGNGSTGVNGIVTEANSLVGSSPDDRIGTDSSTGISTVTALEGGNYVVPSPFWNNGSASDAGAVSFGNGNTGVVGIVSESNSLVGSSALDLVGLGLELLEGGNYLIRSQTWNNGAVIDAGAVTFGSGTSGISGVINESNSLVGSSEGDLVGSSGVVLLEGGNYVVASEFWDNGTNRDAGAVTFGNGTTGVVGAVSGLNSLVGSSTGDKVGDYEITPLEGGSYVVVTPFWDNGTIDAAGAVTLGDGETGITGEISQANSLVGSSFGDFLGTPSVTPLKGGHYVFGSGVWDNGSVTDAGFAAFGNGVTGVTGVVSSANSLVGSSTNDYVGWSVTPLENGNYVVASRHWDNGEIINAGAVTFINVNDNATGVIDESNSLVGLNIDDAVGSRGVTPLQSGNYLVSSRDWDRGHIEDAGAVTFGNGNTGVVGSINDSNSLVGLSARDWVGESPLTLFSDGNYAVITTT